ncbi:Notchless-like protein [Taphrina deformans PYCC 5710]|uniref:Notchless-like protein n=1 Tax=Taphrina deformans (strain PYCC 5710 / ATCC 11124 / CBS 356.35 / IMI 108563 / JCM 9778 / NBRC 8474) TaxID=1097556 RepID=R4XG12_TAPDE|nr:Notchless-like protein [Taphrina deformans PYCC 5710]|eukprot:CCG82324.1 Notchless-like protein [Taphrina deformans PYCC 5710]
MATLVPPPTKRQKREAQNPTIDVLPTDFPSVQVQFRSTDGETTDTILLPGTSSITDLELLLNGHVLKNDEPRPYTFALADDSAADITSNLYTDIYNRGLRSTEDILTVLYTPQSIFRVKAVTRCTSTLPGHGGSILTAQFAPHTSSRCATGAGDNHARIWDCDTETPMYTLKGHSGWVLCLAWAPAGDVLATGSMDSTVRLWNARTGAELGTLQRHTKPIMSMAWEPLVDTPRLATASKDSTIKVWNTTLRTVEYSLSGHTGAVTSVKWAGNGWIYSASYDQTIKVWNGRTGLLLHTLKGHAARINHLALSTDHILRTSFDPNTNQVLSLPDLRARWEQVVKDSGGSEKLVSSSDDLQVFLWTPQKSTKPTKLNGHQKVVNHASFAPNGQTIATASFDSSLRLWSATTGAFIATLRGHVSSVYMCVWSADSRLLASASQDTTVKVWDVRSRKLVSDLATSEAEVFSLDWSCDGRKVVSGGADKKVRLFSH